MKNGRQIMTVVYIPFANLPVLLFCYHIKACQCPDKLSPLFYLPDDVRTFVLYLSAWLENKAGFLKNKGSVSNSGAKHIEENDSVSFCLAKVKFSFLL